MAGRKTYQRNWYMADKRGKHPNARATQFKPGDDPKRNTAGRPALGASVREWLNNLGEENQAEIEKVANDKNAPASKVIAANRLLAAITEGGDFDRVMDRTVGKAAQQVDMNVNGSINIIKVQRGERKFQR